MKRRGDRLKESLRKEPFVAADIEERLQSYQESWQDLNKCQLSVLEILEENDRSEDDYLCGVVDDFDDLVCRAKRALHPTTPEARGVGPNIATLTSKFEQLCTQIRADVEQAETQANTWSGDGGGNKPGVGVINELGDTAIADPAAGNLMRVGGGVPAESDG